MEVWTMANKVLDQLRKLDEQRQALLDEAKNSALANAQAAIAELNELGFNYRLTEGGGATRAPRAQSSGGRRSGIRDDVLTAITNAGADGIKPADIRKAVGVQDGDKQGAQSVSNAISALKRGSKISEKGGSYVAA
jgi:hypothetical protein